MTVLRREGSPSRVAGWRRRAPLPHSCTARPPEPALAHPPPPAPERRIASSAFAADRARCIRPPPAAGRRCSAPPTGSPPVRGRRPRSPRPMACRERPAAGGGDRAGSAPGRPSRQSSITFGEVRGPEQRGQLPAPFEPCDPVHMRCGIGEEAASLRVGQGVVDQVSGLVIKRGGFLAMSAMSRCQSRSPRRPWSARRRTPSASALWSPSADFS